MSVNVAKIVSLPPAVLKFLVEDSDDEPFREYETIGGVFSTTDYAWLSNGPRLQILHTKTGSKIGAWTFGFILKASNTRVVCVDEIQRPNGRLPLLAVGLECDFGAMLCIFDFITSKIIRAIHIDNKITSLHVIDPGNDVFTLPGPLRNFDGVIALGTEGGDVFLIDICRQICDEALTISGLDEIRDELNPCKLCNITFRDSGRMEHHKEFAIRNSHHLAIHLNDFDKSTEHFTLKGPKGDDRLHVYKKEVAVSALHYCSQLGSLLVGFNFGALQLYNLMNLELVYTSPVCDEHIPISHFAVQEPADDPRAVCYIWAVYSMKEEYPSCLPLAVMYSLCYQSKEYHEGYGCLYQDFSNASILYQMELGVPSSPKKSSKQRGGTCLKVNSITRGSISREGLQHESNEDNITLCTFAWKVWFSNKEIITFMSIFDLNQWYKEQMPNIPKDPFTSTYILELNLNEFIDSSTKSSSLILDVHLDKNSLKQYTGVQKNEEHFYPNSFSFDLTCLREIDVVFLKKYGVQKALLAQIQSAGSLCLLEPAEVYQEIIGLGLLPLFIDPPVNTPISTTQQREIILGTALENNLMSFLCKCASDWANGSFLSIGCSLEMLISWAFQRAITLKINCDKFCTSLFDHSDVRLDNNTIKLLNSCTRQLKNLHSLYDFIFEKLANFVANCDFVKQQFKSLETVSIYFEVLQWLLNVGLLPESSLTAYPRSDDYDRISAPYPAEVLIEFYNHRRTLLKLLNEGTYTTSESVLFIDAFIEQECGGKALQEQWQNDGGNGLYPPPSLQSLLRTYLIDNVDVTNKHSVVLYVFLDLAMALEHDNYKPVVTHLIKFPAVFKVSSSVIKITQAFWQLDHGDFNTAMGLLLDPLVSPKDLSPWHHKIALRSLALQKQHNFALLYLQVRKPPLTDDDDVLTVISLYVANNMLDEAFYFEKHFTNLNQREKNLTHLFKECKKHEKLKSLIYRSFNPTDEKYFLDYLSKSSEPTSDDLLVYYHLLRSHFIEAFESHEKSMPNQIENRGLLGQENAFPRDKLIHSLKKLLPDINRQILNVCYKERDNVWQQVDRPTPLSVFVHNHNENVKYKSTLIGAALAKARQTFNETFNRKIRVESEATPFLRTPTIALSSKRSSRVTITPRLIDADLEISPPPSKRLKLSPRVNTSIPSSIPSKLDTPLVQRKTPKPHNSSEESKTATPHSILKVKSLTNNLRSKKVDKFEDNFKEFGKLEYTPVTSRKSGLGLSPRKSLLKSPGVRFEGLRSSSSGSLNNTTSSLEKSSTDNLLLSMSKSTTSEDVFHSLDSSVEKEDSKKMIDVSGVNEKENNVIQIKEKEEESEKIESREESNSVTSPKCKKSFKRQLPPVRSSPRLSKKENSFAENLLKLEESKSKTPSKNLDPPSVSINKEDSTVSPPSVPKLRARKSLCRKVLETNAINKVLHTPIELSGSRRSEHNEMTITNVEEQEEKIVLETKIEYENEETNRRSSLIKKHNSTMSIVLSDSEFDFSFDFDKYKKMSVSDSLRQYLSKKTKSKNKETKDECVDLPLDQSEILDESVDKNSSSLINENSDLSESEKQCSNIESDSTQNKEVEVDVEKKNEDKNKTELVYATLTNTKLPEVENDDRNLIYDNSSRKNKKNKDGNFYSESSSKRNIDPEMNVFEISDDLSYNDGLIIEKEMNTLEEKDLCYGQQNTLENVIEENMGTSGSSNVDLEKNVFNVSYEESNDADNKEEENRKKDLENKDTDVIEIGSSSEEEENNRNSKESDDGNDEIRRIYDSEDYSSDECSERSYTDVSDDSDDVKYNETSVGYGLFHGDIITEEDDDEEVKEMESNEKKQEIDGNLEVQQEVELPHVNEVVKAQVEEQINKEEQSYEEDFQHEGRRLEEHAIEGIEVQDKDEEVKVEKIAEVDGKETEFQKNFEEEVHKDADLAIQTEVEEFEEQKNSEVDVQTEEQKTEDGKYESFVQEINKQQISDNEENSIEIDSLNYSDYEEKTGEKCQIKNEERSSVPSRCTLDFTAVTKLSTTIGEQDFLEQLTGTPIRKDSISVSSRSRGRRARSTPKEQPKLDGFETSSVYTLRSRKNSTEETNNTSRRKRSSSVDETKSLSEEEMNRIKNQKLVVELPKIPEEIVNDKSSGLEVYSMNRRVTRQQANLLKNMETLNQDLKHIDPSLLSEVTSVDEKRELSSLTTSGTNSPVKRTLRSASQASNSSYRSKSKSPTRSVGSSSKKKSSAKTKNVEKVKETTIRVTRSRTRSVSSGDSENSSLSEKVLPAKRRRRVASHTPLPQIREEPSEKSIVPKKRTRKNSSQI